MKLSKISILLKFFAIHYITVSCHYVDKCWDLKLYVLATYQVQMKTL